MKHTAQKKAKSRAAAKAASVKQKRGRPPKQETTTGIPDPYEMANQVLGFKLENFRMEELARLAVIYQRVEGKKYSPAQVARRILSHGLKELNRQIASGIVNLDDPNVRLP